MKTIVLALGNPLRGDDGVATAVLSHLVKLLPPTAGITLLDGGTAGLETAVLLEGYQRAIIIDAAEMGLAPGEWRRFDPTVLQQTAVMQGTLHDAGLAEALQLAAALEIMPEIVIIYGVEPAMVDWEVGLSAPVAASVTAVADAIMHELAAS